MSKKSRQRRKVKRAQEKRAKKQAMRAQYQAWRDAGIVKGSKRSKTNKAKTRRVRTKRNKTKIPFPFEMWLTKDGKSLLPGSPHKAFLALQQAV